MKKWYINYLENGRIVVLEEVEFVEETKTLLKFKTKNNEIVKCKKEEEFEDTKNCHQMIGEGNEHKSIYYRDIDFNSKDFIYKLI